MKKQDQILIGLSLVVVLAVVWCRYNKKQEMIARQKAEETDNETS